MKNKVIIILLLAFCAMSCNKFLDTMPDNRASLDSVEKVERLMRTAYATSSYLRMAEVTSDNYDECPAYTASNNLLEELFYWQEVITSSNDATDRFWNASYTAISAANNALQALDELGDKSPQAMALRGEALVARAYAHHCMLNLFCQAYSPLHANTDLGLPYMEKAETELNPVYERGTLARAYELIDKDLQEGLLLINDAYMAGPKFRMNQRAAYTFASRFYLFYQKWAEAEKWATMALGGEDPRELLRNWVHQNSFAAGSGAPNPSSQNYSRTDLKCNFFITTPASEMGQFYSGSGSTALGRFAHSHPLGYFETLRSGGPWGPRLSVPANTALGLSTHTGTWVNSSLFQSANQQRITPHTFAEVREVSNPVAGTFVRRVKFIALTSAEALLNRAEARVMQNNFTGALSDINYWVGSTIRPPDSRPASDIIKTTLTETDLEDWRHGRLQWQIDHSMPMHYYEPLNPTPKKKIDPDWAITDLQRTYIYTLLHIRRNEMIGTGMRLFDVKRYGIEVERRMSMGNGFNPPAPAPSYVITTATFARAGDEGETTVEMLQLYTPRLIAVKRSPRLVIQLPPGVLAAGMPGNPTDVPPLPAKQEVDFTVTASTLEDIAR